MKKNTFNYGGLNIIEAIALKSLASKQRTGMEEQIYIDLLYKRNYYLRNLFYTYSFILLPIPNFK